MRYLAELVGFGGTDAEWSVEYEVLCLEHDRRQEEGIPEAVVAALLDDESNKGCHFTDDELRQL
eukprot:12406441-Alexandrium_andersonii.AAC.1